MTLPAVGGAEPKAIVMAKPASSPRLLAVPEVADLLQVCTKTIHRWIQRGDLHVHRIGRTIRISRDDIDAFLAKHRR